MVSPSHSESASVYSLRGIRGGMNRCGCRNKRRVSARSVEQYDTPLPSSASCSFATRGICSDISHIGGEAP